MKLYPPFPKIDLYNEGFPPDDLLERQKFGEQLSDLVSSIDDAMVIALDGFWGDGKTFFLQYWVGEHQLNNQDHVTTVYFDAFANDYLEDPLISLTGVILDRIENNLPSSNVVNLLKSAAAKLWRPGLRIGLAFGTAGLSEFAGPIVDAGLEAGDKELQKASEQFWKKEDGKRAAMKQFVAALEVLTSVKDGETEPKKLVIVIDELDRCRPDYAVSVLEVIKHFFAVPNVHFVLGVNMKELQNSIRARYGPDIRADLYLQKFVTLSMTLPALSGETDSKVLSRKYYDATAAEMGIDKKFVGRMSWYLELLLPHENLTLRGLQKVLTRMALSSSNMVEESDATLFVVAGLIIAKCTNPVMYARIQTRKANIQEIFDMFSLNDDEDTNLNRTRQVLRVVWSSYLDPNNIEPMEGANSLFGYQGIDNPKIQFDYIVRTHLETVRIAEY